MKKQHHYYVYILECSDGSYYVGVTNNIERRFIEHSEGSNETSYTFSRRPVVLKYVEHFRWILNAIAREKQLKGWSRKKKEALIAKNWEELKRLSRLRQAQPIIRQAQPIIRQAQPIIRQTQPIIRQAQPNIRSAQPIVRQDQPNVGQTRPDDGQAQSDNGQAQPNN